MSNENKQIDEPLMDELTAFIAEYDEWLLEKKMEANKRYTPRAKYFDIKEACVPPTK